MKDFITYELAVKLKEKGYPQHICDYAYIIEDDYEENKCVVRDREYIPFIPDYLPTIAAPVISQVLKWLREEKDIDLVINPVFFYDDDLGRMREYGCEVFAPSLNKPEHCGYHEKWEQASIAGIEYVLDNII